MDAAIRFIADGLVVVVFLLGAGVFLLSVQNNMYQRYARAFMAGLTAFLTAKLFSLIYQTAERPFVTLGVDPKASYLNNPGFPSDHALFVMTITCVVFAATGRRDVSFVLLALSLLVCLGRVLALVHASVDVVGGILAAYIGVACWYGWGLRRNAKTY